MGRCGMAGLTCSRERESETTEESHTEEERKTASRERAREWLTRTFVTRQRRAWWREACRRRGETNHRMAARLASQAHILGLHAWQLSPCHATRPGSVSVGGHTERSQRLPPGTRVRSDRGSIVAAQSGVVGWIDHSREPLPGPSCDDVVFGSIIGLMEHHESSRACSRGAGGCNCM